MSCAALPSPCSSSPEAALVAAARQGDRLAFEQLYRRHVNRLYCLCLRLGGEADLAEQLVQDAFVQAWRKLPGFRGESSFGTWLHRLTVNLALDRQRERTRRRRHETAMDPLVDMPRLAADLPGVDPAVGERLDLAAALAALPEGARTAFVLHEIEGHAVSEVAALMQVSEGTVKTQLFRARRRLREVLR